MANTVLMQAPNGVGTTVQSSRTGQSYVANANGYVLVDPRDTNDLQAAGFIEIGNSSVIANISADGLTAHAGGTQAAALALTALFNRVTTVGTAADSVALPPAIPGLAIFVANDAAANSMQVFGSGTDTIDAVATATGVAMAAAKRGFFVCVTAGKWLSFVGAKSS